MSLLVHLSKQPEIRERQLRSLKIAKHLLYQDLQKQYGNAAEVFTANNNIISPAREGEIPSPTDRPTDIL